MPPRVFALDRRSLRYGVFPRTVSGLELGQIAEVELPEGTFGKGVLGPTLQQERSFRTALEDLLGRLEEPVTEASLVVPDGWLRVVFADIEDLPKRGPERQEVLRWKLKGLVPFRVEDLRLRAVPVGASSEGSQRWLLAFAVETLTGQLESAFSANGIRIGYLSNVGLSLLEAIWRAAGRDEPQGVVSVDGAAYTLILADAAGPAVFRHKSLEADTPVGVVEQMVRRELRLARSYAAEHGVLPARLFLFAEAAVEEAWSAWLREELGVAQIRPGRELLRLTAAAEEHDPARLVPLIGAASSFV
ncbi:MAG: hypothetical protein R3244_09535 [Thermoanaerobaculia bacterium]|nr:hypothetical protein [Thermoanaerobaculia bacterium]